jgi:hypothetical protein
MLLLFKQVVRQWQPHRVWNVMLVRGEKYLLALYRIIGSIAYIQGVPKLRVLCGTAQAAVAGGPAISTAGLCSAVIIARRLFVVRAIPNRQIPLHYVQ